MQALAITQRDDGNTVIQISGRLDAETCDELEAELDALVIQAKQHIVFDLSDVGYISSAGVRLLLKARGYANRRGRQVVAAFASAQVKRVFTAVGNLAIDAVVEDQSAIDAYLAALDSSSQD